MASTTDMAPARRKAAGKNPTLTREEELEAQVAQLQDDLKSITETLTKLTGEKVDEAKAIAKELRDWVAKEIGPIAKPKDIRFGDNLPKTRSGKIMRRLLRSIAKGEAITQDTSTLENPAILDQLAKAN